MEDGIPAISQLLCLKIKKVPVSDFALTLRKGIVSIICC